MLIITHKFREVMAFADDVTVLRRGRLAGERRVADLTPAAMAEMMVGARETRRRTPRATARRAARPRRGCRSRAGRRGRRRAAGRGGRRPRRRAGRDRRHRRRVGQRPARAGRGAHRPARRRGRRDPRGRASLSRDARGEIARTACFSLPEEPLRNACVARMSVAENMALRNFDRPPLARSAAGYGAARIREQARALIAAYKVKTAGADAPIAHPVGRQRAARRAGARAVDAVDGADRRQSRSSGSTSRRWPRSTTGILAARNARRRGAAGERGPRRAAGAVRPHRGDVRRPHRARDADGARRRRVIGRYMAGHHRRRGDPCADAGDGRAALPYAFTPAHDRAGRHRHAARLHRARRLRRGARQRREPARRPSCRPCARLLDGFRAPRLPVIHTREGHRPDLSDCPPAKRKRGEPHAAHRRSRDRWAASWSPASPATTSCRSSRRCRARW